MKRAQLNHHQGTGSHRLGWWWTFATGLVLVGILIVAIAQNSHTVRVHYLAWQSSVSLVVIVLTTALASILLDEAGGLIWRRRRRARLGRRDELADLRASHMLPDETEPPSAPALRADASAHSARAAEHDV